VFDKEPQEVKDFSIGWSDWLGSLLTIASSSWAPPAGITIDASSNTTTSALVRVSGGTWGETYELFNTIVASNGESETRSIIITIRRSVAYCTPLEVRRRMFGGSGSGGSATTAALPAAELEALIEQASRMFDLECGVEEGYFNPAPIPIATQQTFYGDGTNYLRLPPYVSGSLSTSITVPDGYMAPNFVEQGGYLVLSSSSGVLPPFRSFYNCSWPGWWSGVAITVSAVWGYRETPADVKMAVIELAINLERETDPAGLRLKDLEGQPLREKIPPRVLEIAKKYRMKSGPVFV
jgi:hypothetical protein